MGLPRGSLLLLAAFALAAALPLGAATVLVVARETLDGEPIAPPRPVTEGTLAALFEAGEIVFDALAPVPSAAEIAAVAREAGADYALAIDADCRTIRQPGGTPGLSVDAQITVIEAGTGAILATRRAIVDNAGREADTSLAVLGEEVGREAVKALLGALPGERGGQQAAGSFRY